MNRVNYLSINDLKSNLISTVYNNDNSKFNTIFGIEHYIYD